ncbi:MAG: sodium:solute symporter family protein [Alphaproteobacteria bacterium]|nr:sodium:solute symporter family protein [Alphaproteobacteria bacterium]
MTLTIVDGLIIGLYLLVVIAIGVALRRRTRTSEDFFLSGRSIPAWVAGLAFMSANMGAQEVVGMAASGAKYGLATSHFYWVGAIPAMVFLGLFMMPLYYGSRARSVPEYLKLRFDEKTRLLNATTFAFMTVISSGISMYAMGLLLNLLLGWPFDLSIWLWAGIVLIYVFMGGLTSGIYNEVLQFFLIVFGFAPLVILGLVDIGGWSGLMASLADISLQRGYPADALTTVWRHTGSADTNPLGVGWFGISMGLGFVLSFGYWCTDFLLVQRAMAADSLSAARQAPIIAAIPKLLFPALVILPGMIAIGLTHRAGGLTFPLKPDGSLNYDLAMPLMLARYLPTGLLGLGITALMASFMSGMAGNVTAFNTVWTYDLYQAHIRPNASDTHYLNVGRIATVAGVLLSIAAAYLAARFNNIMDLLQLVFAFVNAPLFATFLLGMFWKRTTGHAAFAGLLLGTIGAALHHGLTIPQHAIPGIKGGWLFIVHTYPSEMAQNFSTAIMAWTACFLVTVTVSLITAPRPDDQLKGLVYSLTEKGYEKPAHWYLNPTLLAPLVLGAAFALNLIFW